MASNSSAAWVGLLVKGKAERRVVLPFTEAVLARKSLAVATTRLDVGSFCKEFGHVNEFKDVFWWHRPGKEEASLEALDYFTWPPLQANQSPKDIFDIHFANGKRSVFVEPISVKNTFYYRRCSGDRKTDSCFPAKTIRKSADKFASQRMFIAGVFCPGRGQQKSNFPVVVV